MFFPSWKHHGTCSVCISTTNNPWIYGNIMEQNHGNSWNIFPSPKMARWPRAKDGRAEAGSLGDCGEGGPLLDFHDWIHWRKWMWRQSSNILKDQWKFIDYRLYSYMIYIYKNLFKEPRWTLKFRRPSTFLLRASRDQLPGNPEWDATSLWNEFVQTQISTSG